MQEKTILKRTNELTLTASRLTRLLGSMPSAPKKYSQCKNDDDKRMFYARRKPTFGEIFTKNFEMRFMGKLGGRLVGTTKNKKGFATKQEAILDALKFKVRVMQDLTTARGISA